jgi:hypothetical protein
MDGQELLKLIPNAVGFFTIDAHTPGVITKDKQGWVFDGGTISPRPITRDEATKRGFENIDADYAAELIGQTKGGLGFLADSKKNGKSSTALTNQETTTDDGQMKGARDMTKELREMSIQTWQRLKKRH